MSNRTKRTKNELERLRLPELQARFREVVGETSRSPNRKFLTRRIEEALAARAAQEAAPATSRRTVAQRAPEPASTEARVDEPTTESNVTTPRQRGRFVSMSVEEMQAKYLEVVEVEAVRAARLERRKPEVLARDVLDDLVDRLSSLALHAGHTGFRSRG